MCAASLWRFVFLRGKLAAATSPRHAEKVPQATVSRNAAAAQAGEDGVKVKSFHCKQDPGNKGKQTCARVCPASERFFAGTTGG